MSIRERLKKFRNKIGTKGIIQEKSRDESEAEYYKEYRGYKANVNPLENYVKLYEPSGATQTLVQEFTHWWDTKLQHPTKEKKVNRFTARAHVNSDVFFVKVPTHLIGKKQLVVEQQGKTVYIWTEDKR